MPIITRSQGAAIANAVPDVLRQSWQRGTWEGVHGSAGLRSKVGECGGRLWFGPEGVAGYSDVRGSVLDPSGESAGHFIRHVSLFPEGQLSIRHEKLFVGESHRGTGFARGFNDQAFQRYAEAGVDDVTTLAMRDGAFVWARHGFEPDAGARNAAARELYRGQVVREHITQALSEGAISRTEFDLLEPRLVRGDHIPPDALTSMHELSLIGDIGKRVLSDSMWHGVREIERIAPWWHGRVPASVANAAAGASYITDPAPVARAVGSVADTISNVLPRALDQRVLVGELGNVGSARTTIVMWSRDDTPAARTEIELADGSGTVVTSGRDDRIRAREDIPVDKMSSRLRATLDTTWRRLGFDEVETPTEIRKL